MRKLSQFDTGRAQGSILQIEPLASGTHLVIQKTERGFSRHYTLSLDGISEMQPHWKSLMMTPNLGNDPLIRLHAPQRYSTLQASDLHFSLKENSGITMHTAGLNTGLVPALLRPTEMFWDDYQRILYFGSAIGTLSAIRIPIIQGDN
jgi:hypothetical protein